MGIIAWIIFGAIAGWIASIITGRDARQGWVMNIVLGIVGALVGGFLWNLLTDEPDVIAFNIGSMLIAIAGAVLVTFVVGLVSRNA